MDSNIYLKGLLYRLSDASVSGTAIDTAPKDSSNLGYH